MLYGKILSSSMTHTNRKSENLDKSNSLLISVSHSRILKLENLLMRDMGSYPHVSLSGMN